MTTSFLSSQAVKKTTPPGFCNFPYLKKSLLIEHRISEAELLFRVSLFFGTTEVSFKSISIEAVENYLSSKQCGINNIDFSVNYLNMSNNDDIDLVEPPANIEVTYSIAFFQAILEVFGADIPIKNFMFSKGVSDKGDAEGRTIVFSVINTNGETVYCADLSGVYP